MKTNVALAEEYYTLVGEKNIEGIKKYLHSEVQFFSPLAKLKGKDPVVELTRNFMISFNSFKIRAKFDAGDQALIIYDLDMPKISHIFSGVSLLNFQEGLIVRMELFFDASHFLEMKKSAT